MLSERQQQVLDAIRSYVADEGYSPSTRELAGVLGISTAATHRALERLRDAGAIEWEPGRARTLRVIA